MFVGTREMQVLLSPFSRSQSIHDCSKECDRPNGIHILCDDKTKSERQLAGGMRQASHASAELQRTMLAVGEAIFLNDLT